MINAEFYKEELLKLAKDNKKIALNINGELAYCGETNCKQCKWNIPTTSECESLKIEWLLEEHKEYPKLTRYEKETLERMRDIELSWIARNSGGEIVASVYSMVKKEKSWLYGGDTDTIYMLVDDFDFIQWKDKEPWSIKELLDNCEVE